MRGWGKATPASQGQKPRRPDELPHPSLGASIYYAVTTLDELGIENRDISNSSAALAASFSPAVAQLTDSQANRLAPRNTPDCALA